LAAVFAQLAPELCLSSEDKILRRVNGGREIAREPGAHVARGARAALLAALLAGTSTMALAAAADEAPAKAAAKPAKSEPADYEEEETSVSELVVTAARAQPGAVVGDIKPELQLAPADIRAYGVSNLTELLDELAPQIRSDRGRGGEAPVVLLNGRRVSSFREIRDIPTEAILRVDILPEEAALKYGYSANQRVVNVVLRRRFRAVTAELTGAGATEGGQASGQAEIDLFRTRGDNRMNFDLQYQRSDALTEDERDLQPITADAAIDVIDTGRFRTLTPLTESVSANGVLAKALANQMSATVNASLDASRSQSLLGVPAISLLVPAGNSYSPFGVDTPVDRLVTAYGPLTQDVDTWTGHLGGTLNKDAGKWRYSLTGAYDHADTQTENDGGLDASALQAQLTGGTAGFNPFGTLPANLLTVRPDTTARSLSDSGNLQFLAAGPLMKVPAGNLFASFKVGDSQSAFQARSRRMGLEQSTDLSRNVLNGQVSFDLPVASRSAGVLDAVGDVSLNLNLAVDQVSDFGALTTLGYGVNWTPVKGVNVIVSYTRDQSEPTMQQLGGPVVQTAGARILDYATGRTVDVTRIDGGNSVLVADERNVLKVGLTWKPFTARDLTISGNYVTSRIENPIATFPAATAQIEAAFPDRFVRDASGELTQVDYRPVNFAREDRKEFRWGFNYSRPVGPQQAPPAFRRPPGEGGPPPGEGRAPGQDGAPRGAGGPGGFRGGPGGGGFGGGQNGRLQFALYHTVIFQDEILIRPGVPVLDLLNGAAAGASGGQPQNEVEAQLGFTQKGLGARLSADWKSATTVRGGLGTTLGDLNFSDITKINLRLFADLGAQRNLVRKHPWLRGSRITLSANNLFDQRVEVRDANGLVPASYQPAYLDPAGRTVKLSFRKLFF
jgi:iron complex outermembrane receptor protein